MGSATSFSGGIAFWLLVLQENPEGFLESLGWWSLVTALVVLQGSALSCLWRFLVQWIISIHQTSKEYQEFPGGPGAGLGTFTAEGPVHSLFGEFLLGN